MDQSSAQGLQYRLYDRDNDVLGDAQFVDLPYVPSENIYFTYLTDNVLGFNDYSGSDVYRGTFEVVDGELVALTPVANVGDNGQAVDLTWEQSPGSDFFDICFYDLAGNKQTLADNVPLRGRELYQSDYYIDDQGKLTHVWQQDIYGWLDETETMEGHLGAEFYYRVFDILSNEFVTEATKIAEISPQQADQGDTSIGLSRLGNGDYVFYIESPNPYTGDYQYTPYIIDKEDSGSDTQIDYDRDIEIDGETAILGSDADIFYGKVILTTFHRRR